MSSLRRSMIVYFLPTVCSIREYFDIIKSLYSNKKTKPKAKNFSDEDEVKVLLIHLYFDVWIMTKKEEGEILFRNGYFRHLYTQFCNLTIH